MYQTISFTCASSLPSYRPRCRQISMTDIADKHDMTVAEVKHTLEDAVSEGILRRYPAGSIVTVAASFYPQIITAADGALSLYSLTRTSTDLGPHWTDHLFAGVPL